MEEKYKYKEVKVCEYIRDCQVPKRPLCWDEFYSRCTIYQRRKILERARKKFPDGNGFIGSKIWEKNVLYVWKMI